MMNKFFVLAAILLGFGSVAKAQSTDRGFVLLKNIETMHSIVRELDMLYVDTLDMQALLETGIDAMLESLDPYTEYYAEEDLSDLKMMTTGKYGGMGSLIRQRKDSTVIIAEPYADMPAAEAGLKVGDVLLNIDKHDLKGMTTSQVTDLLRGEPGTTFLLRFKRPGEKKPREVKITRRSIKLPAIPYYGLHGSVGYISLTQFTEGCAKDMRKAVINLKERGAKSLVLDLRGNGGGLLNEAVDIVNLFVPKGIKIVETKGKIEQLHAVHKTHNEPLDTIIPLAVLVNGNSASASEIVSGSLQDLDRATIIGTNTYGKGLVQATRNLPYNGNLKLTTAKYYIPSGRCIQAIDYKKRREQIAANMRGKKNPAGSEATDSLSNVFYTKNGREVREGHGIKPDIEVKHDTLANIVFYLSIDDILIDYGTKYCQAHETIPAIEDFRITDEDYAEFRQMVIDSKFTYDRMSGKQLDKLKETAKFEGYYDDARAEFEALEARLQHNLGREMDHFQSDIRKLMASEIVKRYYYQAGTAQEALKDDIDFKKAIEILEK